MILEAPSSVRKLLVQGGAGELLEVLVGFVGWMHTPYGSVSNSTHWQSKDSQGAAEHNVDLGWMVPIRDTGAEAQFVESLVFLLR